MLVGKRTQPFFVIVKLDLRNAYNAISRAAVIRRLTAHPSLAFLVPLLHAMTGPESQLLIGSLLDAETVSVGRLLGI